MRREEARPSRFVSGQRGVLLLAGGLILSPPTFSAGVLGGNRGDSDSGQAVAAILDTANIDLSTDRHEYSVRLRLRVAAWVLAGIGAAGLGVGGYGYLSAGSVQSQLQAEQVPINLADRGSLLNQGQTLNAVGLIGLIAGGAAIVASLVCFVAG